MIRSKNPERDAAIVADRVAGMEFKELAVKYGLAYNRVRQLLRDAIDRGDTTREAARIRLVNRRPVPEKPLFDRLMSKIKIDPETGCWIFTGGKEGKLGYGSVYVRRGLMISAHRAMYQLVHGVTLTRDQFICHRCDNGPCCNPGHLFLGTLADNNKDMAAKGRYNHQKRTHCIHGHEFTPENTYRSPGRPNKRACRTCQDTLHKLTPEERAARKIYDGSVRRKDRKKFYRELAEKRSAEPQGAQQCLKYA